MKQERHFIITGGAGFIGSHLTQRLLSSGYKVTVVDDFSGGSRDYLPEHSNLRIVSKNLSQCQAEDFIKPIEAIAHLAAIPSVQKSWSQPLETNNNNFTATTAAIALCNLLEIKRLVFTSSAAVYGNPTQLPLTETQPTNPNSPYGLIKLMGEQYSYLFTKHYGLSTVNLRLFNVFGKRQSSQSSYSGVIASFISALQEDLPINIYGDGTQTRDFIYVEDVVTAFVQALTVPLDKYTCFTCNIGSGQRTSILKLVEILKDYYPNKKFSINFLESQFGDIKDSWADTQQAEKILLFKVKEDFVSSLEKHLKSLNVK